MHLFWHRLCFCREGEHYVGKWNGGIYDFKNGNEYHRMPMKNIEDQIADRTTIVAKKIER